MALEDAVRGIVKHMSEDVDRVGETSAAYFRSYIMALNAAIEAAKAPFAPVVRMPDPDTDPILPKVTGGCDGSR